MKLAYSPEHEALRQELRAYYGKLLTPEILAEVRRSEGVGPPCGRSSGRWARTAGSASAGRRNMAAAA